MTFSNRTSYAILSTILCLVASGCGSPNKGPVESRLEGSWEEVKGRIVFWTLGLFPVKTSVHNLRQGPDQGVGCERTFDDPIIFTFQKDGSVDWSRSKGYLSEPGWTLSTKGDRTIVDSPDGPAQCLELTEARFKPDSTRIEITGLLAASKLYGKITLTAVLTHDDRLRLRIVVRNPMGMPFHQEYSGRFARKKE